MEKKYFIKLGLVAYLTALILDLIVGFFWLIAFPRIADWETFSYSIYGIPITYMFAYCIYSISSLLLPHKIIKGYIILLILLICVELVMFFLFGDFMVIMIIEAINHGGDYIVFLFPVTTIIGYFWGIYILRSPSSLKSAT
ncbi:hypothetical protein A8B79_11180 [Balneola sp. EhC07]|jgi:hypothetical protein|nr:hypothetical protein A8B79_11180 [Balneola sp. EhC07]